MRELTNHAAEIWAFRSLDHEIYTTTIGVEGSIPKGPAWLRKHLVKDYYTKWEADYKEGKYKGHTEGSLTTTSLSRLCNYYCQGLEYLTKEVGIDGLYIDDVSFGRKVMQRVRRILDRNRPNPLIDLHSSNHYNAIQGWANPALLYLELFPYIDSLWFGEWFNYEAGPDYWLVEISGIPFGLMGQTLPLDTVPNPWRGMVFGMTDRMPWLKENNKPMWGFWESFGIAESEMIGWWRSDCPISSGHKDVPVTVYRKADKSLAAFASWAKDTVEIKLDVDWKALGLSREKAVFEQPAIEGFQDAAGYKPGEKITVPAGKGFMLVIRDGQVN
jgi:hypothetical protein